MDIKVGILLSPVLKLKRWEHWMSRKCTFSSYSTYFSRALPKEKHNQLYLTSPQWAYMSLKICTNCLPLCFNHRSLKMYSYYPIKVTFSVKLFLSFYFTSINLHTFIALFSIFSRGIGASCRRSEEKLNRSRYPSLIKPRQANWCNASTTHKTKAKKNMYIQQTSRPSSLTKQRLKKKRMKTTHGVHDWIIKKK